MVLILNPFDFKNVIIKLPQFNKNYPFKTKWGIIYIRLITLNGLDISGFELAVIKRTYRSFWFKQKKQINLLDYYIKTLCDQVRLPYVGDKSHEPKINKITRAKKYVASGILSPVAKQMTPINERYNISKKKILLLFL